MAAAQSAKNHEDNWVDLIYLMKDIHIIAILKHQDYIYPLVKHFWCDHENQFSTIIIKDCYEK